MTTSGQLSSDNAVRRTVGSLIRRSRSRSLTYPPAILSDVTRPRQLWNPTSEDELRRASDDGLLIEDHHLDLKREVGKSASSNRDLAKDIAAFALDGGMILLGVDEDNSPPSLHPIDLQGLPERVEQIAGMRVDEGVEISTVSIPSTAEPARGYLVVHIPASPRAPHMVEGKYYGRGDKANRILSHAEVLRLHERQLASQRDIVAAAREILGELVAIRIIRCPRWCS